MRRMFTEQEQKVILKEYVENKRGLLFVSKQVKSTPETIKKFLREKNIHIRNFSEAATESNKNRALKKNEKYFQNENENMAWLLGFLASDGTIRKERNQIKIGLSKTDKEILEKIREELQLENEVKEYITEQGYECVTLQWTSEQHKNDLTKYSIIPEKTFQLKPPYSLNKKYWIDFIRGFFDGDGTINTNGHNGLRFSICSATKEILEWIITFLNENFQIPKVNILTDNRNQYPLYYFTYSTNSTKKIFEILYSTKSTLYLQRKKEKYEKLIKEFS